MKDKAEELKEANRRIELQLKKLTEECDVIHGKNTEFITENQILEVSRGKVAAQLE